jgi:hypothetical protein
VRMRDGHFDEHAADSVLEGKRPQAGEEFDRVGALLHALTEVPPLKDGPTSDPIVARMAAVIRESPAFAAPEGRASHAVPSRLARERGRFFRTRLVAGLTAAILLVGGGLAFAGALPASLQNPASHLLHRIGIHVPAHVEHPASKGPVPAPSVAGPTPVHHRGHEPSHPGGGASHGGTKPPSHGGDGEHGGQGQQGGDGSDGGGSGEGGSGDGGSGDGGSGGDHSGDQGSGSTGDSGGQGDQGAADGSGSDQ